MAEEFPGLRKSRKRSIMPEEKRKRKAAEMKLGVVLEGGASRTIFSCGVTDVLLEEKIMPDYLIGVSAGIAYGVSYVSGQQGRNEEFTRKYMHEKRYMGLRHWLDPRKRCYYNLEFAFGEIPNRLVPYDYDALAAFPGKVVAVVTNVRTGEAEYKEIPPYETRWETTIASCSIPVLFPPVDLGGELYMDGGIADPIPFLQAAKEGCDRILVILTRERGYRKKTEGKEKLVCRLCGKYPKIVEKMKSRSERYNRTEELLAEWERQGKVFVIAPEDTLGVKLTEGRWEKLEPLYREGLRTAREKMKELKAYLKTG
jgi:predicted patatin/cPLA2 family phospholipase